MKKMTMALDPNINFAVNRQSLYINKGSVIAIVKDVTTWFITSLSLHAEKERESANTTMVEKLSLM